MKKTSDSIVWGYDGLSSALTRSLPQSRTKPRKVILGDTSFLTGRFASWLEIPAMTAWNAHVASTYHKELSDKPSARTVHRFMPILRDFNDRYNSAALIKLQLHHQLLSGVVVHLRFYDEAPAKTRHMDNFVVRRSTQVVARRAQIYETRKPAFSRLSSISDRHAISDAYDELWSEFSAGGDVLRLYYRSPATFEHTCHYIPDGVRTFLKEVQCWVCPCPDACDLRSVPTAIDHIVPRAEGGTNVLTNLQATCSYFNSAVKRSHRPVRPPDYLAAIANATPGAWLPVGYHAPLLVPQMDLAHVRAFATSAGRIARRWQRNSL